MQRRIAVLAVLLVVAAVCVGGVSAITSDRIGFGATSNQTGIQGSNGFNNGIYSYNGVTESTVGTAYADDFATNTSFRYATALYNTSATVESGDPNVLSGKFTMVTNTYTMAIGRLKSYKFGGGVYEFNFDNNNDGGSVTDFNGAVIAESDLDNFYRVAVGNDTAAGTSNISIYKKVAGTLTLINVTDTSTSYIRSNKTWMKIKFDPKNNILDAWVRDDTGSYPTAANVRGVVNSGFNNSYFGFYSMVGTNGLGNLNVDFDDLTINSELVVGFTNIPDTVNGGFVPMYRNAAIGAYWNGSALVPATRYSDDFNFPTIAEYTQVYRTWTINEVTGYISAVSTLGLIRTNEKYGSGTIKADYSFSTTSAGRIHGLIFAWDGTSDGAGIPYNCYVLTHFTDGIFRIREYNSVGSPITVASGSNYVPSANTPYQMSMTWNQSTGFMSAKLYSSSGAELSSITTTDTTYQNSNYTGLLHTHASAMKTTSLQINALESTSPSGINAGIDSVAHGAMYDTANTASIEGYAPMAVQFKDVGSQYQPINPTLTRNWTYQGIATGNNTQKTFATSSAPYAEFWKGNWSIKLNSEDIAGTKESPQSFWINVTGLPLPILAQFTPYGPQSVFLPNTTAFNDASTGDSSSWSWDFGDGTTSVDQNPVHQWTSPGIFHITLTASNAYSSSTNSTEIEIQSNDFTANQTHGYVPLSVQFTGLAENTTSRDWDFGDGTAHGTTKTPVHTYNSSGFYTVSLTSTTANDTNTTQKVGYIEVLGANSAITLLSQPIIKKNANDKIYFWYKVPAISFAYNVTPELSVYLDSTNVKTLSLTTGDTWYPVSISIASLSEGQHILSFRNEMTGNGTYLQNYRYSLYIDDVSYGKSWIGNQQLGLIGMWDISYIAIAIVIIIMVLGLILLFLRSEFRRES